MRNIALGADHGGYELKTMLIEHLKKRGFEVTDCGTFSKEAADYPKFALEVASRVASGQSDKGIMIDGAGIGSSMAANKVAGVRAALCYDVSSARNSREHNNANVCTLGALLIGSALATQIVDVFLDTECTAERHLRRVDMIMDIEKGNIKAAGEQQSSATAPQNQNQPAQTTECKTADKAVTEDILTDLSPADLQRVADRIASMMAAGGSGSAPIIHCDENGCSFCTNCTEINPDLARKFISLGADRITHRGDGSAVPKDVAQYIDHTLLKPDATYEQVDKLCKEAAEYSFASVCVNPVHVKRCADQLRGTSVKVCTVVGFPLGANTAETKALEARRAIREGAKEIDMVINVGALKSGDDEYVYHDIRSVVEACIDGSAICKVILETALLTDDEKTRACVASRRAKADFVKTSTGFGPGGATVEDVALMSKAVAGARMGVKASGGIRSYEDAEQMIKAGATRLGASAGVKIVAESKGGTVSDSSGDKY